MNRVLLVYQVCPAILVQFLSQPIHFLFKLLLLKIWYWIWFSMVWCTIWLFEMYIYWLCVPCAYFSIKQMFKFLSRANIFCCYLLSTSSHSCVIFSKSAGQYLAFNIV